ncbi:MAG: 4-alpha-glucanotransferase, partial [Oscillospiraceae bacterium]|nr:4-alpha-glucanotransferase [Oscillospiraceae bacterium]
MNLKKQKPMPRGAGVLLPAASLPSPYGIGTFGRAAYDFIDFLRAAGQRCWQVLPLGPTSYGDSPYQSFSAFAGNPYFIDLDLLAEEKLLQKREIPRKWGNDPADIDYARIFGARFAVLHKAFMRSGHKSTPEYDAFLAANAYWVNDYAEYMAVKEHFGWKSWQDWPAEIRRREKAPLSALLRKLAVEADFWRFCQFKFYEQWGRLKEYANASGIEIIGDIPIYVAFDSADVWANPHLFELDGELNPTHVAGVPPDYFSKTGQLWGNPLYRWDVMRGDGFAWWRERIRFTTILYNIVRIDHFIGIVRYYAIPAAADTAVAGHYREGPGEALIAAINEAAAGKKIIAEDLGVLTPKVERLRRKTGYPGMKILQFAFDSGGANTHLPGYYEQNTVVYGGTHDNETLTGYFARQNRKTLRFTREYLGVKRNREIVYAIIRLGYQSCANTAIYQLQDLLAL